MGSPDSSKNPLLKKKLFYATERGLYNRMITNGQALADRDFFQRCVDAGLSHIHVSLHSYRQEVHDYITQYPRAYETLVQCLENVPRVGITCDSSSLRPTNGVG